MGIYWEDNVLLHPGEWDEEIDAVANIASHGKTANTSINN